MTTYKRTGQKSTKQQARQKKSATAEVFKTLDSGASRIEVWVIQNRRYISIALGTVVLGVLGYMGYRQFIQEPKEKEAAEELFFAQRYFNEALNDTSHKDSLYQLALNGAEGKYGFLDIIDNYRGTRAANLARYSAGMAYLEMNKYREAVGHLQAFSSSDMMLSMLAKGAIGDAFMQLNQPGDALSYYEQALSRKDNEYLTPRFLFKAGLISLDLKQQNKALIYFRRIKNDFPKSEEGNIVDAYIGRAENLP